MLQTMAVSYVAADGEVTELSVDTGRLSADRIPWRSLRIAILLAVLLVVSVTTCEDRFRSTAWRQPLYVAIYPIRRTTAR